MATNEEKSEFWRTLLRAVEVEPRPSVSIRGASGFSHPVVSVGVDEERKRVVIISGESDARSAALAHGDIQAAMPSLKVMMARPVAVNLGEAARILSGMLGRVSFGHREIQWLADNQDKVKLTVERVAGPLAMRLKNVMIEPFSTASLNLIAVWKEIIQQLSLVEIETVPPEENATQETKPQTSMPTFHFTKLIALDPAEADRRLGVCSIPLYGLETTEVEIFHSGRDVEAARDVLRRQGILQYFFPSADHLTLGFAERLRSAPREIVEKLARTPEAGHPFGQLEIVEPGVRLNEMVSALQERGLLVEGEAGVEITEKGRSMRAQVRFKPREGLLARLANVLSVKIDLTLKDLFNR
jgi:hypothetical protein